MHSAYYVDVQEPMTVMGCYRVGGGSVTIETSRYRQTTGPEKWRSRVGNEGDASADMIAQKVLERASVDIWMSQKYKHAEYGVAGLIIAQA